MKKTSLILFLFGILFSGCISLQHNKERHSVAQQKILPDEIVGVWISDQKGWAFKIEKDGSINKLSHMLAGKVTTEEGGVEWLGPEQGTYATFILGPIELSFNLETQMLSIKATMAYYDIQLPYGRLIGRSEDTFIGKVDLKKEKWEAEWRSYGWLDGADEPNVEEIEKNPVLLTFTKLRYPSENIQ